MSPMGAWRVGRLGFGEVSEYGGGKLAWMAAGLATEGTNAKRPLARDLAHTDVPTCRLDERLEDVRDRTKEQGWDAAGVIKSGRIGFWLLRGQEPEGGTGQQSSQAKRPGPGTLSSHLVAG